MPGRAPADGPAPWSFERAACHADLDALEELLTSKAELSERRDVLRFFTEHPHLSAFLGSYHPNATAYDRLGVEVELFGQFTADVIAEDKTSQAYALLEFEDGRTNSMFVRRGRQTSEWAQRFEHAFGQIIDWLWLLDDQQHTLAFEEKFGPRPISIVAVVVAGRDSGVSMVDRRRLRWREEHVVVNSHHIYCNTYDDLLRILRRRLNAGGSQWLVPPPNNHPIR